MQCALLIIQFPSSAQLNAMATIVRKFKVIPYISNMNQIDIHCRNEKSVQCPLIVKYFDIRFKYVFLRSRKQTTKTLTLFILPKLFLFLLIWLMFYARVPQKCQYDMKAQQRNELFYLRIAEHLRSGYAYLL